MVVGHNQAARLEPAAELATDEFPILLANRHQEIDNSRYHIHASRYFSTTKAVGRQLIPDLIEQQYIAYSKT